MSERNRLSNGRFLQNLDGWTASGATYSAGDGDDHYGVAVIQPGGRIEQEFGVPFARSYLLHLAVKPAGADLEAGQATLMIEDGEGNTLVTADLAGSADTWSEQESSYGLGPGTTYTLTIANASAAGEIKLDDIWLWWVPLTRAGLAGRVHTKLDALATALSWNTTPAGALTEGDYTYAVDAGLRAVGAIDPETDLPDVRWLEQASIPTALDEIEREMLEQAQRAYLTSVDTRVGPRDEKFSQVALAIGKLLGGGEGGGGGRGRVVVRKLAHEAKDFEL